MEETNKVKISVVIPMYNAQSSIVRALDSVKNQTYQCIYEIIVVNDGSKDNSKLIVENYIANNSKMDIILINQLNGGVSKARNTGLKKATGDYIAFLDSDDAWLPSKTEKQIKYLDKNFDFICGLRNNENVSFPYILQNNFAIITLRKLLLKVVGQTSTALFKREVLTNVGMFDESQKYSEDANLWMRISLKHKMIIINETLAITDNDYGSLGLSSNFSEMQKGVIKNITEMWRLKAINSFEYYFYILFSKVKFLRRKYNKK